VGVLLGMGLVALLSAVNFLRATPADYATGASNSRGADAWVSSGGSATKRTTSLFFTSRRTWGPSIPGQHRHKGGNDL
jgi:hypothetical protein